MKTDTVIPLEIRTEVQGLVLKLVGSLLFVELHDQRLMWLPLKDAEAFRLQLCAIRNPKAV